MRALLVVVGLLLCTHAADARPKRPTKHRSVKKPKQHAAAKPAAREPKGPRGQSIGAPWSGSLRHASKLRAPERTHVRRPHRAFGTRTTISHVRRAISDTLEQWPKVHELAIGDLSAERGGRISEHNSHQSGRDIDLGLIYREKPEGYPAGFVTATASTLHKAAMWTLISNLASTAKRDGGVHIMFLDFEVQGMIFKWAKANGAKLERLERIFQYPHGRGAAAGLIRHEPNHADHLHVRFKCAEADTACR